MSYSLELKSLVSSRSLGIEMSRDVSWSPNGQLIAIASQLSSQISIIQPKPLKFLARRAHSNTRGARALSWSPDNLYLAVASSYETPIHKGKDAPTFPSAISIMAYDANAAEKDKIVEIARVRDKKWDNARTIEWSPNGQFLVIPTTRAVEVLEFTGTELISRARFTEGHDFRTASWSPNGLFIAGTTRQGELLVLEFTGSNLVLRAQSVRGLWYSPSSTSWSPDGRFIALSTFFTSALAVFEFTGSDLALLVLETSAKHYLDVEWSPDGYYIAVVGLAGYVEVLRFTGPALIPRAQLSGPAYDGAASVAWSPDGQNLALSFLFTDHYGRNEETGWPGDDTPFKILKFNRPAENLDYTKGALLAQTEILDGPWQNTLGSAWSNCGTFVLLMLSNAIFIAEYTGTALVPRTRTSGLGYHGPVIVKWRPGDNFIAVASSSARSIAIIKVLGTLGTPESSLSAVYLYVLAEWAGVSDIAWSPNGQFLSVVLADTQTIEVFEFDGTNLSHVDSAPEPSITDNSTAEWSPDSQNIAVTSSDTTAGNVSLLNFANNNLQPSFVFSSPWYKGTIRMTLGWNPTGQHVAISQPSTGTVGILETTPTGLVEVAQNTSYKWEGAHTLVWDSGGQSITVAGQNFLGVLNVSFAGLNDVTSYHTSHANPGSVSWSPTCQFIVYVTRHEISVLEYLNRHLFFKARLDDGVNRPFLRCIKWSTTSSFIALIYDTDVEVLEFTGTALVSRARLTDIQWRGAQDISWSPNGQFLATIPGHHPTVTKSIAVLEFTGSALVTWVYKVHDVASDDSYTAVEWSPNGQFLALVGSSGHFEVLEFTGVDIVSRASINSGWYLSSVSWSPNGQYLVVYDIWGGDPSQGLGALRVYEFTGSALIEITHILHSLWSDTSLVAKWSPDSSLIAVTSSLPTALNIFEFTGQSLVFKHGISGHTPPIHDMDWDGSKIVQAGPSREVKVLELSDFVFEAAPPMPAESLGTFGLNTLVLAESLQVETTTAFNFTSEVLAEPVKDKVSVGFPLATEIHLKSEAILFHPNFELSVLGVADAFKGLSIPNIFSLNIVTVLQSNICEIKATFSLGINLVTPLPIQIPNIFSIKTLLGSVASAPIQVSNTFFLHTRCLNIIEVQKYAHFSLQTAIQANTEHFRVNTTFSLQTAISGVKKALSGASILFKILARTQAQSQKNISMSCCFNILNSIEAQSLQTILNSLLILVSKIEGITDKHLKIKTLYLLQSHIELKSTKSVKTQSLFTLQVKLESETTKSAETIVSYTLQTRLENFASNLLHTSPGFELRTKIAAKGEEEDLAIERWDK